MKNLKIKVKLIGSFLIVVALAIVVGVVGIVSLTSAASETALLNDRTGIAIESVRLNRNIHQQRAAVRGAAAYHLMMGIEEKAGNMSSSNEYMSMRDSELDTLHSLTADFQSMYDALGAMITTEETKQYYTQVSADYAPFQTAQTTFETSIVDPNVTDAQMMADMAAVAATVQTLNDTVTSFTQYLSDITDQQAAEAAQTAVTTTIILVVVLAVAAIFSIILALFISNIISKPLGHMQTVLVQTGTTGNLTFTDEQMKKLHHEGQFKDEVGQSIGAFMKLLDRLVYVGARLKEVASGDLTADVETLGAEDDMGNALKEMNENLNNMFADINSVALQVSTASTEIAQGAQSLAQGSTEQASTVQEISASINEITQQSGVSVSTANDAASESRTIRGIAQDGNDKMHRLTAAVQEMSDASQSIGNVIKVIDDIAFQTNILALNAAVEAARAGQHGKGFAVVADEVRSLAGKSAEAAKETAGLISANIAKSELGLTLSNETAETLTQIVQGVEKTTESLGNISQQNESSKAATEQVNLAVDQVAQVVQQNSATSEQSAAASEEMSSQAQMLQQLVGRFKLRDASRGVSGSGSSGGYSGGGGAPQIAAFSSDNMGSTMGGNVIF